MKEKAIIKVEPEDTLDYLSTQPKHTHRGSMQDPCAARHSSKSLNDPIPLAR